MRVPNYLRPAILILAFVVPAFVQAQVLSRDEKTAAIREIAQHIAANYVNVELGGQIASAIQLANQRGEFILAKDWHEFGDMVTRSLRKLSGDQHLFVRFDPAQAKKLKAGNNDTSRMYVHTNGNRENSMDVDAKVLDKNFGYIKISEFNINDNTLPKLIQAMRSVKNTDALIIDLRDNQGGGSDLGAVLESYFLPADASLLDVTSRKGETVQIKTVNWVELKYDNPVYVIVNNKTASAAEAFAFCMQQHKRAKVVGETSSGAAYMNDWFPVGDHSYVSVSTAAPRFAGSQLTWQGTGVKPDIRVKRGDPVTEIVKQSN